jgi:hypothetical protein
LGNIILAAHLVNKVETMGELGNPNCLEIREIKYRFYEQEIAEFGWYYW